MVAAYISGIQPSKTFYLLLQLSPMKAENYMPNNRSVEDIELKGEIVKKNTVFEHLF